MSVSIAEAILQAAQSLRKAGVPEARREAGSLLAHAISKDRTFIISHAENALDELEVERFREFVTRRATGEPLQYITGMQEFFGLEFKVTKEVLIPRPETELLVETALEILDRRTSGSSICDIGTGSGCIAITLVHEKPNVHAVAVDVSEAAIRIAQVNAKRHSVNDRISFVVSDCFEALGSAGPSFDLVVSNPPYVADSAMEGLPREVKDHEPRVALAPGGDGMGVIRRLLSDSCLHLKPAGFLLMEIGFDQHHAVERLIDRQTWRILDIRQDLQGIPRLVALQRTPA